MPANVIIRTETTSRPVPAVWRGASLAVHRPIIDGKISTLPKDWTITHIASGLAACRRFNGTKSAAVSLARLWDASFQAIPASGSLKQWPHAKQWLNDLAIVQNGTSQPAGPVELTPLQQLESASTPSQIQTAVARAMGYEPMSEEEGAEQFEIAPNFEPAPGRVPYHGAVQLKPSGSLWFFWIPQGGNYRDHAADLAGWYQVPLMAEIEDWSLGSVACSPCDDDVEPDHPDSWLVLLGMI